MPAIMFMRHHFCAGPRMEQILCEALRSLYENLIGAQAKIHIESRK
jgi:hypothetical protein